MTTPDSRLFARVQARSAARAERRGGAAIRRELAAGLSGHVLELGPGSGLQFAYYPADVRRVTAIEPEPTLRHMALRAPSAVPVTVLNASAAALPLADASIDAVVCSAVLCSVDDVRTVLREIARVLRPAGQLRLHEHVRAQHAPAAALQHLLDRSGVWRRLMGGCRTARDPVPVIRSFDGLAVEHVRRFALCPSPLDVPVAPKLVLTARRVVSPSETGGSCCWAV